MRRRATLASVVALLAVGGAAVPASAAQPTRETLDRTETYTINNLCSFPIEATSRTTGESVTYYNRSGDVVRVVRHLTETDTFSANGETLTGLPYRYNVRLLINDGELEHFYVSGILIRVELPDGKVFKTAGRLDFLAHPNDDFVAAPDKGRAVNLEPFCAALS